MTSIPTAIPRRRSVALLAMLTLGLIVFSYLFTFAIAIACAVLPLVALLHGFGGLVGLMVAVLGLILAGTILWSLVPRREKFEPLGVPLQLKSQPRLKALVEEIAMRLGEEIPSSILLIPDPNAFVTNRGGQRIMGLGLPLMAAMTVSEFRAVLAHEFAHFYSGDTRLGPRIYQTRGAMARALKNLGSDSAVIQFLTRFGLAALLYTAVIYGLVTYWKLFLRVTQLVSRKQEYRSDELACYIAGPAAMARGLERVSKIGAVAPSFWASVIQPAVAAGFRPPLADGLQRYYNAPAIQKAASGSFARLLETSKVSAYDTHPPINLRLDRISKVKIESAKGPDGRSGTSKEPPAVGGELNTEPVLRAFSESPTEDSPAISLLDDIDDLEKQLLTLLAPDQKSLSACDWDSAASTIWLPAWKSLVKEHETSLAGQTVDSLPELLKDLSKIGGQIRDPPGVLLTREQRTERAANLVASALTLRLIEQGWVLHMQPGQFFLSRGELKIVPRESIEAMRAGRTSASAWKDWCRDQALTSCALTAGAV